MTIYELQAIIHQADRENQRGNCQEAEQLAKDVLTTLAPLTNDTPREVLLIHAHLLHHITFSQRRRGLAEEALATAQEAFTIVSRTNSLPDIAQANVDLGAAYHYLFEYTLTIEYYNVALAIYEQLDDKKEIASTLTLFGVTYGKTGNNFLALDYYTKAVAIYEEIGESTSANDLLIMIGNVLKGSSQYSQALEYYIKALDYYEACSNKRMASGARVNIGQVYSALGSNDIALEYYQRALVDLDDDNDGSQFKAVAISSIGDLLSLSGDNIAALEYYQQAYALFHKLDDRHGAAATLINIGSLYIELGNYDKALEINTQALAECEEIRDQRNAAAAIGNLGWMYASIDFDGYNPPLAEEYLQRSLALCEKVGAQSLECEMLGYLAALYEREERWQDCTVYLKKYHAVKDEIHIIEAQKTAERIEFQKQYSIERAKAKATENILHKVLPPSIATRLIKGEKIADYFESVSILFADIVGFTPIAAQMPARNVLAFLNYVFGEFDRIIESHGCEKIKTIGDGYMAVAGAPIECSDHAERIARAAMEMMGDIQLPEDIRSSLPKSAIFNIRIGINIGPAFGGIVGESRFVYDIYSDAVNTAARMESHGEPGRIHMSEDFAFHLQNRMDMVGDDLGGIVFVEREEIEIKGKGMMKTYFLEQKT